MTTQVLMSSRVSLSEAAQAEAIQSEANSQELVVNHSQAVASVGSSRKLPYQANHQVELLHLQAETEALLQHLKTLKQQRTAEDLPQVEVETVLTSR